MLVVEVPRAYSYTTRRARNNVTGIRYRGWHGIAKPALCNDSPICSSTKPRRATRPVHGHAAR